MLCDIISSTSSVITIFTERYSRPCALWIDTAYATWNGTTVLEVSSSSSSTLFVFFTTKRITELPAGLFSSNSNSCPQASISFITVSSSMSNCISSSAVPLCRRSIATILPFMLLYMTGANRSDSLNSIGSSILYCKIPHVTGGLGLFSWRNLLMLFIP